MFRLYSLGFRVFDLSIGFKVWGLGFRRVKVRVFFCLQFGV